MSFYIQCIVEENIQCGAELDVMLEALPTMILF